MRLKMEKPITGSSYIRCGPFIEQMKESWTGPRTKNTRARKSLKRDCN